MVSSATLATRWDGSRRVMVSSATLVTSILYQRGIYPAESFKQTEKYGLNMLVTDDDKLNDFFTKFLQQLSRSRRAMGVRSSCGEWRNNRQVDCVYGIVVAVHLRPSPRRRSWLRSKQSSGRSQRVCRSYRFWKSNSPTLATLRTRRKCACGRFPQRFTRSTLW
uniref:Uncharacterized protein n=1 Tax=Hyaloperonospora arabidopsidis (strain Emoy2) TaxID=559515 RepID=M4C3C4_HYAAE